MRGGTTEQRHAQPVPAAETAQEQPETDALRTEHGSSSRYVRAAEGSGGNTGAAAQPSDDSEEEEQEVGWKRPARARSGALCSRPASSRATSQPGRARTCGWEAMPTSSKVWTRVHRVAECSSTQSYSALLNLG